MNRVLVGDAIAQRLESTPSMGDSRGFASLPESLWLDRSSVRVSLFRRLAASRNFAFGDRAGVLRSAQRRSGRTFRLDVRQRVIVKALVCRHAGVGAARGVALARHIAYLGRAGAGVEGAKPEFFDETADRFDAPSLSRAWSEDRHHFRFIVSPEHGDRIADLRGYVREVMGRVSADLGEPTLTWVATCHFDTDQPHAHVLVRGRRADGRDLVIPRDYMGYGLRARAQEVAHELLGDLTRADAERRVWRETEADRFTLLDRRLVAAADSDGFVADGVGRRDAWAALTRGRLRHLERLGLAERIGGHYRLATDLEPRLRGLQIRRDVIRTLNQRRVASGLMVQEFRGARVRGRVVQSGFHDELGAAPFAIIRDRHDVEHYAQLAIGQAVPIVGRQISLDPSEHGVIWRSGLGQETALGR